MRRLITSVLALFLIAGLSLGSSVAPVGSQTQSEIDSLRAERERVESAEAAKAAEVNVADAEVDELAEALEILQARVNAQSGRVDNATRQLETAEAELTVANERVAAAEIEIAELQARLADRAISSFIGDDDSGGVIIGAADPNQAVRMQTLTAQITQSDVDVAESLRAAQEDLDLQRVLAGEAADSAEILRAEQAAELVILDEDRAAQAAITAQAEERLDRLLGERASLAALGVELDGEISDKEDALAARLAAAAAAPRPSSGGGSSGGGGTVSSSEIQNAGNGIWVHRDIVGNVRNLLAAAEADGVTLAGGGYRDPAGQIAVRKNNCGTSQYAIYEMPASSCRPPTARPGSSMHEQGRAIDFTYGGRIIGSRSGAAWNWLNANAASYGLYNLPSEPWHWSTNGR